MSKLHGIVLVFTSLAGCVEAEAGLVGSWRAAPWPGEPDDGEIITFVDDGTYHTVGAEDQVGTWLFAEGELTMTNLSGFGRPTLRFSVAVGPEEAMFYAFLPRARVEGLVGSWVAHASYADDDPADAYDSTTTVDLRADGTLHLLDSETSIATGATRAFEADGTWRPEGDGVWLDYGSADGPNELFLFAFPGRALGLSLLARVP